MAFLQQYELNFNVQQYTPPLADENITNDLAEIIKNIENKMAFIYEKLNIETPSIKEKKYSDWKEFLDNLSIKYNEDIVFLLEQNFDLPISKKNTIKRNDLIKEAKIRLIQEISENVPMISVQYLLNQYGFETENANNYPDNMT
jgi:hypothetical protein